MNSYVPLDQSSLPPDRAIGPSPLKVLPVGGSVEEAKSFFGLLRRAGYDVQAVTGRDSLTCDLVVHLEGSDARTTSRSQELHRGRHPDAAVIVLSDDDLESRAPRTLMAPEAHRVVDRTAEHVTLAVVRAELNALEARRKARHFERLYREMRQRCKTLLAASTDAVAYVADGMHLLVNDRYVELFGLRSPSKALEKPLVDLVAPTENMALRHCMHRLERVSSIGDKHCAELTGVGATGRIFRASFTFTPARYKGLACYQLVVTDLSKHDAIERQIDKLRSLDSVTGLLNRQHFMNLLAKRINQPEEGQQLALIELENFRTLRERIGITATHDAVAELLHVMTDGLGRDDVAARVGDYTVAVLASSDDAQRVSNMLETLRSNVESHICEPGAQSVATTCSIGVVTPDGGWSAEDALAAADRACREAIRSGGNQIRYHHATPHHAEPYSPCLEAQVPQLLEGNRLSLVFQPIVSLHGPAHQSYEVLLRAQGVDGEAVAIPALFEAAANIGLASAIDCWVIEETVKTASRRRALGQMVQFFVKLSRHAIKDESVLVHLTKVLRSSGVDPTQLVFQLDEEMAARQMKMARTAVNLLKKLRCFTALEHFGKGHSSFNALTHLDVDYLKLDGSCVDRLADDFRSQQRLGNIQRAASTLNKATVATSVQDASSLAILWECGVQLAQGHYIQEPASELSYEFFGGAVT